MLAGELKARGNTAEMDDGGKVAFPPPHPPVNLPVISQSTKLWAAMTADLSRPPALKVSVTFMMRPSHIGCP